MRLFVHFSQQSHPAAYCHPGGPECYVIVGDETGPKAGPQFVDIQKYGKYVFALESILGNPQGLGMRPSMKYAVRGDALIYDGEPAIAFHERSPYVFELRFAQGYSVGPHTPNDLHRRPCTTCGSIPHQPVDACDCGNAVFATTWEEISALPRKPDGWHMQTGMYVSVDDLTAWLRSRGVQVTMG